jgi:hypothetical protein
VAKGKIQLLGWDRESKSLECHAKDLDLFYKYFKTFQCALSYMWHFKVSPEFMPFGPKVLAVSRDRNSSMLEIGSPRTWMRMWHCHILTGDSVFLGFCFLWSKAKYIDMISKAHNTTSLCLPASGGKSSIKFTLVPMVDSFW